MRLRLLLVLIFATICSLQAQSTEADLNTRLMGKTLYLHGFWSDDKLHFDSSGQLISKSKQASFTTSGVDVKKVHLQKDKLVLDGLRIGLAAVDTKLRRVILQQGDVGHTYDETLRVTIDLPAGGVYTAALDAIFVDGLANLVPLLPAFWKPYATKTFLTNTPLAPLEADSAPKKFGGKLKPPVILKQSDPSFSDPARKLNFQGKVLIHLILDETGTPTDLSLLQPAGLGLDERAIDSVQHYDFQPVTDNGNPIRVQLNIEVNFQIF